MNSDGLSEDYDTVKKLIEENQKSFGKLRDRVERKRQEIQGLSDGVGHLNLYNIYDVHRD